MGKVKILEEFYEFSKLLFDFYQSNHHKNDLYETNDLYFAFGFIKPAVW